RRTRPLVRGTRGNSPRRQRGERAPLMLKSLFRSTNPSGARTDCLRMYYASDVHGSEQCWRKFLGAARFYGAQALIMGGDLTGKALVPIIRSESGHFSATFMGQRH